MRPEGPAWEVGPSRAYGPRWRRSARSKKLLGALVIGLTSGCAAGTGDAGGPAPPAGGPGIAPPGAAAGEDPGLDSARIAVVEGRWADVAALADSALAESAGGIGGGPASASPDRVIGWAGVLAGLGEELRAVHLLLGLEPRELGDAGGDLLRWALHGLSSAELSAVEARVTGRFADFVREERELRTRVAAERGAEPVRIGAVLPLTGRFAAVGEELRDGILLALEGWSEGGDRLPVELVVRDDSSRSDLAGPLVRELAAEGVTGIVGPIRSEALRKAARARPYAGLALVSPTATEVSDPGPNAYTLWERARREAGAGRALGRWLVERLGLRRLAALVPDDPAGAAGLAAFREAVTESGGEIVLDLAYEPVSTTFEAEISAVAEVDPEGVLVLADAPRSVLQIAPQLSYYGLRSRVIAGGASWADPAVLRRLEPTFADFRLVATPVDRGEPGTAWARFRDSYEKRYRRGVPESVFAALGFDAATLLLAALPEGGAARPGALARSLRALEGVEGATGVLYVDDERRIDRRVDVRMLLGGSLVPADSAAIAGWAEEARAREQRLDELEEEGRKAGKARAEREKRANPRGTGDDG